MTITIRPMASRDIFQVTDIFNDAIVHTTGSFDSETKTTDQMTRRFFGTEARYPHLVAEQGTKILGWASIGAYSERCAYADTGEVSVYISPDWKGRGIGSQLFEQLIAAGRAHSLHSLIARIGEGNPASLALHHRWGFEDMGFLPEIGFKFGRRLGVHILQLRLMIPTA